ncbi:MAG: exodeoxyribonuclease III Xth [Gammaproteobacteria bacterium]|nr:MAG: exodeoxyribonuclease III Xth [Gammaproteobacteria bacterium]TND05755.1 MAG: exodeoxyribonuclease III Xth [Gammaproteobacteria bacterium]
MKIASWNVNSLRVRLPQVLDWLARALPDVLAMQETKLVDENFPEVDFEAAGYKVIFSGQKTYNGVAIASRLPARDMTIGIPDFDDPQRRVIAATYGDVRVVNLYVPNGQSVDSDKYRYKLDWLNRLTGYLEQELERYPHLVVLGDFNIAPEDRDVHDPDAWRGQVLFSEPEHAAFRRLLALGMCDTFRQFDQADKSYSWWDYRMNAFRRNMGLRIDHVLASHALCKSCVASTIDTEPRRHERPSDHAPVMAEFNVRGVRD